MSEIVTPLQVYQHCYKAGRVTNIPKDWLITPNFSWQEAFCNEASTDNVPGYDVFRRIYTAAVKFQAIRTACGKPWVIHSWYRSVNHNRRAGSTATLSPHIYGVAIDFHIDDWSITKTRKWLVDKGFEIRIEDNTPSWVHIDTGNPFIAGGYYWGLFKP